MKIQVIKKGTVNAKPSSYCEVFVDDTPLTDKQRQMTHEGRPARQRPLLLAMATLGGLVVLAGTARCTGSGPAQAPASSTLRVGFGSLPKQTAEGGLPQFASNLSFEGLINLTEDGRPR